MTDFLHRSYESEILDNPAIPFSDIQRNMEELNTINLLLGGHATTLKGFKTLLGTRKKITVCEVGCGGGNNLFAIYKWCKRYHIKVRFIGIDMNPHCIRFAKNNCSVPGFDWVHSDYRTTVLNDQPDIIFNSLFCHHFKEEEIVVLLQWMRRNSKRGFFINDLHRHPLAYYSIKWITRVFSKSYLVKNDAPLSVLRGFRKKEWERLLNKAEIDRTQITWRWAFRHLIICKNE